MALSEKSGIPAAALAELLRVHLRHQTIEYVVASAPNPEAATRRIYDILHGRTTYVTLRVADELSILCGRPDWMALL